MNLELRKQFASFDPLEFKYEGFKSLSEVISEFNNFPWSEELAKSNDLIEEHAQPSIHLKNGENQKLSIYVEEPGLFSVSYSVKFIIYRSLMGSGFTKEFLPDLIQKFAAADKQGLRNLIKTDRHHHSNSLILDFFSTLSGSEKNFVAQDHQLEERTFTVTLRRSLLKFSWSLIFLLIPTIIILTSSKAMNLNLFLIIQTAVFPFALPGIIILVNYLKRNQHQRLLFKKGQNMFLILSDGREEAHDKRDFVKRVKIESNANNAPWTSFEYSVLVKTDGTRLFLSNILIDSSDVDRQFGRLAQEHKKKWIPTMPG
jgi:hypothetical protein